MLFMTTSHVFYYLIVVMVITSSAYIYTSKVEAPHLLSEDSDTDQMETVFADDNASSSLPVQIDLPTPKPNTHSLSGSSWMWVGIIDSSSQVVFKPRRPEAYMLQFTENRLSSRTDCNTIGGNYEISGSNILIGEIMSTLMFCENSDEGTYSASLNNVVSFEEKNGSLYLYTKDNSAMVFNNRIPN